jgi:hypothetical protein
VTDRDFTPGTPVPGDEAAGAVLEVFRSLPEASPARITMQGQVWARYRRALRVFLLAARRRWWLVVCLVAALGGIAVAVASFHSPEPSWFPYVLSTVIGVGTGVTAWLVVARLLSPDFLIDSIIRCECRPGGTLRYRVVWCNRRAWSATDIRMTVRLSVPMADVKYEWDKRAHARFESFAIDVGQSWPAQLPRVNLRGNRLYYAATFGDADLDPAKLRRFGHEMRPGDTLITWMRQMREVGDVAQGRGLRDAEAHLHVSIRGAHWYSGTYRTVTRSFTVDDFRRSDMQETPRWYRREASPHVEVGKEFGLQRSGRSHR